MRNEIASCITVGFFLGLGMTWSVGCAGVRATPELYDYFAMPARDDAWSPKIAGWQRREKADDGSFFIPAAEVEDAGPSESGRNLDVAEPPAAAEKAGSDVTEFLPDDGLRGKYFDFRAERRRSMARDLAAWIQSQARAHYIADGPLDHWATLEETLRSNGDDCDGLELLVYHALRDLGFGETEVYRSIVYRPSDGQHHMVTLWFEDRNDPWVIDPTGAMTRGMPRMSDMPDWVPIKVFGEAEEYTVRTSPLVLERARTLASHP